MKVSVAESRVPSESSENVRSNLHTVSNSNKEHVYSSETIPVLIQKILIFTTLLLPFIFLPFTVEVFETPKTIFLLVVDALVLGLLAFQTLKTKKFQYKKSTFYLIPMVFLLVWILSTVFSTGLSNSIYGVGLSLRNSLISIFAITIFVSLCFNYIENKLDVFKALSISGLLVAGFLILKRFITWGGDWEFVGSATFVNTGSLLIIFLGSTIIASIESSLQTKKPLFLIAVILETAVGLTYSVSIIDWLMLFAPAIIYVLIKNYKSNLPQIISIGIGIFVGVCLMAIAPLKLTEPVTLNLEQSWKITFSSLGSSIKNGIIGQGMNNFGISYNLYKDPRISQTDLWDTQFITSFDALLDMVNNSGIVAILSILLIGFFVFKKVKLNRAEDIIFLGICASFIFYQWNTITLLLFFISCGLIFKNYSEDLSIDLSQKLFKKLNNNYNISSQYLMLFFVVLGLIAAAIAAFLSIGDLNLGSIKNKSIGVGTVDQFLSRAQTAQSLLKYDDLSSSAVAQLYYQKSGIDSDNGKKYFDLALDNYKRAIQSNPANYGTYIDMSKIYSDGINKYKITDRTEALNVVTYAAALNPYNPTPYFIRSTIQPDVKNAIADLMAAINIRSDFVTPYLQLGKLYIQDKEYDKTQSVIDYLKKQLQDQQNYKGSDIEKEINDLQAQLDAAREPAPTPTPTPTITPTKTVKK